MRVLKTINPGRSIIGQCLSNLGQDIEDIYIGLNHLANTLPALEALVSGYGKNLTHFGLILNSYQITDWGIITDNMTNLKSLKLTFASNGRGTHRHFAKLKYLENLFLADDSRNDKAPILNDET